MPDQIPRLELSHGAVLWVLSELGFKGGSTISTFNAYLKSLRKLGIPFATSEVGRGAGHPVSYDYGHVMELGLVLTMRFYFAIPDVLLKEIVRWRPQLGRLYRQAYLQRERGLGAPRPVGSTSDQFEARGVFLDLQLRFAGGKLTRLGPPRALNPLQALQRFVTTDIATRSDIPIPLSQLAEGVVRLSIVAPLIRRGPRPARAAA